MPPSKGLQGRRSLMTCRLEHLCACASLILVAISRYQTCPNGYLSDNACLSLIPSPIKSDFHSPELFPLALRSQYQTTTSHRSANCDLGVFKQALVTIHSSNSAPSHKAYPATTQVRFAPALPHTWRRSWHFTGASDARS